MAEAIDPGFSDERMHALDDLNFGIAAAKQGAALQLRTRAAELRNEK